MFLKQEEGKIKIIDLLSLLFHQIYKYWLESDFSDIIQLFSVLISGIDLLVVLENIELTWKLLNS